MSEAGVRPFFVIAFLFLAQNLFGLLLVDWAPALVLIGVIYFSMRHGPKPGIAIGAFAGSLAEIYGQGPLGFYIASWAAVGGVTGMFSRQIFQDSLVAEIVFPGIASYALSLVELLYRQLGEGGPFPWWGLIEAFRPTTVFSTVLSSLALFSWLRRLPSHRRRGPRAAFR